MSFYQTHLDTFESILKELKFSSKQIEFEENQNYCFDIYVIDMQNGFMSSGECGVLDSDHLPGLICEYLDYVIHNIELINQKMESTGTNIKLRFVFSRDYHHPDHYSFQSKDRPTGFPAHCQYGTHSSMFHSTISDWIKKNRDQDITITFKAFHPHIESYSTLPYTEHYDASKRQGTCCDSHKLELESENCLASGGGVYFPDMKLDYLLEANPFSLNNPKYTLINSETFPRFIKENAEKTLKLLSNAKSFKQTYLENTIHHSFVMGLAGDFCVRDTLINSINQRVLDSQPGEDCLIYNLTAYVTLPFGDHTMSDVMDPATGKYVSEKTKGSIYNIWVTPIRDMILDYIDPSRGVCLKPPLFIKYETDSEIIKDDEPK